jgi:predicted RNA-binding protein YlxR (DUF448 family)
MTLDPSATAPTTAAPSRRAGRRHVPERTCAGCGGRAPRAVLARIGLTDDGGGLEWRANGGRGTYLHEADECRRRFVAGKKRLPGLRASIGRAARESLVDRAGRNR